MAKKGKPVPSLQADYSSLIGRISGLLDQARRATVRVTNALLTATYWEIGRQIVEFEQGGHARAEYGEELLRQHGRGYSRRNLQSMRLLCLGWEIFLTPSGKLEARVKCAAAQRVSEPGKMQTGVCQI